MLSRVGPSLPPRLVTLERLCSYDAIHRFAVLSDDFNPIHVDREFAAASPMGGIIAHGPLSLGLVFQALSSTLGVARSGGMSIDVYFRRPVRENDTVTAGGELRNQGSGIYAVWVKNQRGEVVLEGEARMVNDAAGDAPSA